MPVLKTDEGYVVATSHGKRLHGPFKTEQDAAAADNLVEQVMVGEAANQGELGLRMVAEVIRNRAKGDATRFEKVATKPKQFSALDRPDGIGTFYGRQPENVRALARFIASEVAEPEYAPRFQAPKGYEAPDHYMTAELYDSPKRPRWAKDMKVVAHVGDHVLLARKSPTKKK